MTHRELVVQEKERRGISYANLSKLSGIKRPTIILWLKHGGNPNIRRFMRLLDSLNFCVYLGDRVFPIKELYQEIATELIKVGPLSPLDRKFNLPRNSTLHLLYDFTGTWSMVEKYFNYFGWELYSNHYLKDRKCQLPKTTPYRRPTNERIEAMLREYKGTFRGFRSDLHPINLSTVNVT